MQVLGPPQAKLVPSAYAEAGKQIKPWQKDQVAGGKGQAADRNDSAAGRTDQAQLGEMR